MHDSLPDCPILLSLLSPYVRTAARRQLLCCSTPSQQSTAAALRGLPRARMLDDDNMTVSFVGDSSAGQLMEAVLLMQHALGRRIIMEKFTELSISSASWNATVDTTCALKGRPMRVKSGGMMLSVQLDPTAGCRLLRSRRIAANRGECDNTALIIHVGKRTFRFYRADMIGRCLHRAVQHAASHSDVIFVTSGLHYNDHGEESRAKYTEAVAQLVASLPSHGRFITPFPQHFGTTHDGTYNRSGPSSCKCVPLTQDNWRLEAVRNVSGVVPLYDVLRWYPQMHKRMNERCMGDCTHYCYNYDFWNMVLLSFDRELATPCRPSSARPQSRFS